MDKEINARFHIFLKTREIQFCGQNTFSEIDLFTLRRQVYTQFLFICTNIIMGSSKKKKSGKKSGLSAQTEAKKKVVRSVNPFERRFARQKHQVLNRKPKEKEVIYQ